MFNQIAFAGAIEVGFLYGFVALGLFLSFRVLDFPDLTVDGSFPLGAAVAATLITTGTDPYLATLVAVGAGACAGFVTGFLNTRFGILHLLASILTMISLHSINLRIMGRPNIALINEATVLTPLEALGLPRFIILPIVFGLLAIAAKLLLDRFMAGEIGLAMRATGANPRMARANGINTAAMILLGMAIANAFVALAGALFAQANGAADVTMGVGVIVIGLASVIGGEAILSPKTLFRATLACLAGSMLYQFAVALALQADFLGLRAQDLKLITALLVAAALVLPGRGVAVRRMFGRGGAK
ncbi:ABC transporter permease [Oceanibacterium hippocampi]|uniref:Branched-chain amino acid transport system / permease component n=1 Tax=Oceanibacterium hippocampi TaxID=745714 RepID=A0A1Y5SHE5_9PROT|nr:ABC transporter permease [Oceanibacterium hippocampi]SLN40899.1 Branched-chain amino acid transport system / permease component [Oceanibacterium hippocampi]